MKKEGESMNLQKIFETKSKDNQSIYTRMFQTRWSAPVYTEVNYAAIAKEGYSQNFVIFRCMQEIVKAACQLRIKVMKRSTNGEDTEVINHPIVKLLERPNPLYGQSEFLTRAISFYYLGGEAPIHKLSIGKEPKELYVYRPDRIQFTPTGDPEEPYRDVKYNGGALIDIGPENFLLWKHFNPIDENDGLGHGMSPLQPILKNGDLLNEMINWNMSLMQNGGNLSGVILVDQQLDDNVYNRAEEQIKNKYSGRDNVGKYMLLEGGGKFQETGITPKDADWIEGKKSTIVDICMGIGIDPIVIGYKEFSSYNNAKEAYKALYTSTVIPLMQGLMDELTNFLKLDENEYLDIDYSHIPSLQEDLKEIYDRLAKANDMTINEKRQARGLEEIEGGDIIAPEGSYAIANNQVYLPMNLIPIGEEGEDPKKSKIPKEEDKNFM